MAKKTIIFTLKVKGEHEPPVFDKTGVLDEGVLATQEVEIEEDDIEKYGMPSFAMKMMEIKKNLIEEFIEVTHTIKEK